MLGDSTKNVVYLWKREFDVKLLEAVKVRILSLLSMMLIWI